jgi:uncharacterized protein YbjT (DUF2867 family)
VVEKPTLDPRKEIEMATPLTVVVGATGTSGGEVVKQLAAGGHRVRALRRDTSKTFPPGVEVVEADLARPSSLSAAFAGATAVFVATPMGPDQPALEGNAFEAAKRAGAMHIVKVSANGAVDLDLFNGSAFRAWNDEAESRLRATGIPWTILRPGSFHTNLVNAWGIIAKGGLFLPAGDGKDSPVDPRDVAAVAVEVLTERSHQGRVHDLMGPELLSFRTVVEKVGRATGKELTFVDVPEAVWIEQAVAAGLPPPVADSLARAFAVIRTGRMYTTSTIADILGRPARNFDQWLKDNRAMLRA